MHKNLLAVVFTDILSLWNLTRQECENNPGFWTVISECLAALTLNQMGRSRHSAGLSGITLSIRELFTVWTK